MNRGGKKKTTKPVYMYFYFIIIISIFLPSCLFLEGFLQTRLSQSVTENKARSADGKQRGITLKSASAREHEKIPSQRFLR